MLRKLIAVLVSVVLLSAGWLGFDGLPLLIAFVPLLWISGSADASHRAWWGVFGWALLTFVLWNAATVWWVWNATWVGPVAATLASSFLNMVAFMLFHTLSKRTPKVVAYTMLVAAWTATEYWYTVGEFSFPWLILGNGFCEMPWGVQWYEFTGVFGGSLWVLVTNILVYEAWRQRRRLMYAAAAMSAAVPMAVSLAMFFSYTHHLSSEGSIKVSVVQPNVDCYDKFSGDTARQESNLLELLAETPADADFVAMPETALTAYIFEPAISYTPIIDTIASVLRDKGSRATVVTGANTWVKYTARNRSRTARFDGRGYYDLYNSAVAVSQDGPEGIYHKSRLVIGVEKTPLPKLFEWLDFLVIDLGGTVGQLGVGDKPETFEGAGGVKVGPAICYEALYGDWFGGFVHDGARAMLVISNDGWWGDTPGYKRLFAFCRLRAIEHRRAIARSANTGISGFIDERGCDGVRLGWDKRGVLTDTLTLNDRMTFYTRHGDYIGRAAELVMLLCLLWFAAVSARRLAARRKELSAAPKRRKARKKRK